MYFLYKRNLICTYHYEAMNYKKFMRKRKKKFMRAPMFLPLKNPNSGIRALDPESLWGRVVHLSRIEMMLLQRILLVGGSNPRHYFRDLRFVLNNCKSSVKELTRRRWASERCTRKEEKKWIFCKKLTKFDVFGEMVLQIG